MKFACYLPLLLCLAAPVLHGAADAAAVRAAQGKLRIAQAAGDEPAVRAAAADWRAALHDEVGQPEGGTPKRVPAQPNSPPDAAQAAEYLAKFRAHQAKNVEEYLGNLAQPTQLAAGLRQLAVLLIADAQVIAANPADSAKERAEAVRLANALCGVQRPNGLFAFPDIRAKSEFFGRMIDRLLEQEPNAIADGWVVSDAGNGDLQYDNGLCGVALLEAHQLTNDARYLDAARRAGEWAKTQPIVPNWNYNSFTVWFLARLAIATKDRSWLDEASRRNRLGIVPGQMENGRWFDPHNAKLVYHAILCRALVELAIAHKELGNPDEKVERAAKLGLDNAADEILNEGVSVVTVPTEVFSQALLRWRDEPRWREALHALAAAGLARRAPNSEIGPYAAAYYEYASRAKR